MIRRVIVRRILLPAAVLAGSVWHATAGAGAEPKGASDATRQANAAVVQQLPFADQRDFEDARRGLIDEGPATIRDARGHVVWDIDQYAFLKGDDAAPDTVNP